MINVFIGYDQKMPVLYNVLQHSIQVRASQPVSTTPVMLTQLEGIYSRSRDSLASTEFSFSRFLVPYLSGYKGWSIFLDNDMVMLSDIADLWKLREERFSVMCTKHNHEPASGKKFLDTVQTRYQKKNWSSCMMFNNEKCKALTPDFVNSASGLELHQFKWLDGDDLIGEIPLAWNYLADNNQSEKDIKMVHFTEGGPYFNEYADCELADVWRNELSRSAMCAQREDK